MKKKYKALRIVGIIYKVLGGITAIITVLAVVSLCATTVLGGAAFRRFSENISPGMHFPGMVGGAVGGLIGGLILIIYFGGAALTLYGLGEGVDLMISLEENTRKTAQLLETKEE